MSVGCTCGAFSGAVVVLNLLYGADKREPQNPPKPKSIPLYAIIKRLDQKFKEKYPSTCCRVLTHDLKPGSSERAQHCATIVGNTAEILWTLIDEVEKEPAVKSQTA